MPPKPLYTPLSQRNRQFTNNSGGGSLEDVKRGIAYVETRGAPDAYSIKGKPRPSDGKRALGKYQVFETNLPDWTREALGQELTADEFLANPEAQEKVADHFLGKSLQKYGNPEDAASVWFTGRSVAEANNAADYTGTDNATYQELFKKGMGMIGGAVGAAQKYIPLAARSAGNAVLDAFDASRIAEVPGKTMEGLNLIDKGLGTPARALFGDNVAEGFGQQVDDFYGVPGRVATGFNENVPTGFSQQVEESLGQSGAPTLGFGAGLVAGFAEPAGLPSKANKAFEGFTDLSTKLLEKLKGRTTVSRQFIEDMTNSPDLKQAERDLIRKVLDEGQDAGDTYYHATTPEAAANIRKIGFAPGVGERTQKIGSNIAEQNAEGVFTYKNNEEAAKYFLKNFPKGEIVKATVDGKVLRTQKSPSDLTKEYIDGVRARGYVGVQGEELGTPYTFVFDKNAIKPKSDQISVPDFANKVKSELLPLTRWPNKNIRYESISLPDELRGPVGNYSERVYTSPIKTSAGDIHFSDGRVNDGTKFPDYFAHSRIEDLPASNRAAVIEEGLKKGRYASEGRQGRIALRKELADLKAADRGGTRRVIEIQSDLFQKGRLEGEMGDTADEFAEAFGLYKNGTKELHPYVSDYNKKLYQERLQREKDIPKLEPYRNTWHERVIREEVKQAAKEGKTKLQFPTGETAMKIEGLGERSNWTTPRVVGDDGYVAARPQTLSPENLKVGEEVWQSADRNQAWIITDVLGDGKFKAVPKDKWEYAQKATGMQKSFAQAEIARWSETFDISGKVDTENPIYRFYDKTVRKYLTNKYGAKEVTDAQGVKWLEVDVKPEQAKTPVEAFGALLAPLGGGLMYQQGQGEDKT